jgi:hypothetical protein
MKHMDDLSERLSSMIRRFDEETKARFCHAIIQASQTGAYEDCWCHSGEMYRECHFERHTHRKISEGEVRKQLSKIFDSKKYCSASFDEKSCKLPIKGAHTVQRGRVLSSMAKDGHVGTFYRNINGFEKLRDIKTGIKKEASIFYGFCEYHDTGLFKDIELNEFTATSENCWASSYRAVCHEYYQKNAAKEAVIWQLENLDKGYELSEQLILQEQLFLLKRDVFKGFEDISSIKNKYEKAKVQSEYDLLSSYVTVLDEPLCLSVSATMSPYYNISGVKVQNLGDPMYLFQHFALSTVTVNGCAAYVVSYLKEHNVIEKYLEEVFEKGSEFVKSWLTKCIFAYAENAFFNLDWWSNLRDDKKISIYNLAMSENYTVHFEIDDLVSSEIPGSIVSIERI